MKIKAAVVREKGKPFQFEELDLQDPRAGEVMVRIAASGVCHTDEVAQQQIPEGGSCVIFFRILWSL